mmetsp:Transcript_527/g.709  ORF Transcript_527/g.709 Transcript_527/m.709 type:complete len:536 (+) Transcript_527:302-1909(+)|eukprot:CAMPEP_0204872498 /NCGR_PEP_ID=MMETSP1348-20121228/38353_1 /ASSEMBLY_ACC=CAM_ASM_000700 /TAXON_ID=215587 /ORGANISM="Aplanochytrium stocchinoi, Strain GSBS06" /LENGTH=535 /DNA_ID=CAMNT_0052027391 /DNA_START=279 /DNA_END=1886 /DNA_ORIENTATION=-
MDEEEFSRMPLLRNASEMGAERHIQPATRIWDNSYSKDDQVQVMERSKRNSNGRRNVPRIKDKHKKPSAKLNMSGPKKKTTFHHVVPRKVVGKMRKSKDENIVTKGRIGMHAFSYELDLEKLQRALKRQRRETERSSSRNYNNHDGNAFNINVNPPTRSVRFQTLNSIINNGTFRSPAAVAPIGTEERDNNWLGEDSGSQSSNLSAQGVYSGYKNSSMHVLDPDWEIDVVFDVVHLWKRKPTVSDEGNNGRETETQARNTEPLLPGSHPQQQHSDGEAYAGGDEHEPADLNTVQEIDWSRYDVFLYEFGSAVFWNFEHESEELDMMRSLTPYMRRIFEDEDLIESASDSMDFFYANKSSIRHDVVQLSGDDPQEKLTASYAFAQSSLLSIYEWRLDKIIENNENIPQELAKYGKISMTQEQVSKEIGRLFMERNSINLESDILDTPPFFWENDKWDPFYNTVCNYLEQDARVDILNRRLDCVHELLEVLTSQAENQHASRLEWIVIWLVASEVFISLFWNILIKDILGYFPECRD